ncbi:hypothetical protein CLV58_108157 [Spirosoma oryzae]|uniref:Uncharacterized protein n=2 Tax=Spirosoma oryzae TaxID=1469603 RepID=A0A2T0T0U4_9BACT|nr:hypothetical protein CLV58_108157 [Spirosoma oryzae]
MTNEDMDHPENQSLRQDELEQIDGGRPGGQPVQDMPVPKVPVWYTDPETGLGFWLY